MNRKAVLRSLAGAAVAAVSLWLAFRNVAWDRALEGFRSIGLGPASVVVGVVASSVCLRAMVWKTFAGRIGDAPYGLSVRCLLVGMVANNVLPARLGELARSGLWGIRTGLGPGRSLGILAAERSLDLVALGVIALAVLPNAPVSEGARRALGVGAAAGVVVAVAFVVLARVRWSGIGRASRALGRLAEGFASLGRPRELVVPALLSGLVWCVAFAYMVTTLRAFDIEVPLRAAALLLLSTQLAVVLPSAPSFAGPYHLAVSLALTAYGVDRDRAAGFAIFNHLAWVVPTSIAGAAVVLREGIGFGRLVGSDRDPAQSS